jgi:hypothetical protein
MIVVQVLVKLLTKLIDSIHDTNPGMFLIRTSCCIASRRGRRSTVSSCSPMGNSSPVGVAVKVCSWRVADMEVSILPSQKIVNKKVDKIENISLVCTFGVVSCGLAVIVAATVRVIKDIFKSAPSNPVTLPPNPPTWEVATTTTVTEDKPRRRRRQSVSTTPTCEFCGEDLSKAQIIRSESHDDQTFLIKSCPSCSRECSIESR